jgi:2-dehydro-3-deoxygluconokinase
VSETAAQIARSAALAAAAMGARLSIDINHRPQLWQATRRTPYEALQPLLQQARIVFATPIDWGACLPIPGPPPMQDSDGFPGFAAEMFRTYPALELLITGYRAADDSSNFELGGVAQRRGGMPVVGKRIRVRAAAERIGSGDAFVAGCLFGFLGGWPDSKWLDFGIAARALKHTIPGDINLTSVWDVESLLGGDRQGSVLR